MAASPGEQAGQWHGLHGEDGGKGKAPDQIPSKVLAEFVYCPRAGYIEWVEADFRENAYTLDGERLHQRVDRRAERHRRDRSGAPVSGGPPHHPGDREGTRRGRDGLVEEQTHLWLASEALGLTAVLDLVEILGDEARPVEYRRHRHLDQEGRPPLQDRVQLCVQAMLLEEQGYHVPEGAVYYADVRKRVPVIFDEDLRRTTLDRADELRALAEAGRPPAPLLDSPKCEGCSLVGLCLPDEINLLSRRQEAIQRRLVPSLDEGEPLFVAMSGSKVRRSHSVIKVTDRDKKVLAEVGLSSVSQVGLFGNVQVTTQALRALAGEGVTVSYMTAGGWLYGVFSPVSHKNIGLRIQQFRSADHPAASLALARAFVETKILNSRTLLMRNAQPRPDEVIEELKSLASAVHDVQSMESLLGIEGSAARLYFSKFSSMLRTRSRIPGGPDQDSDEGDGPGAAEMASPGDLSSDPAFRGESASGPLSPGLDPSPSPLATTLSFEFNERNRRPPRDPVNAMLSYSYALLLREVLARLIGTGFDPYRGFYHQPRYGRPCLALDLMEEFRSILADSVVITVVNNGILRPADFVQMGSACNMRDGARKKFIRAFARRMDQEVTHPLFGYRVSYRRIIEVQARLLARYLLGDMDAYVGFRTR